MTGTDQKKLLTISGLDVSFHQGHKAAHALRGVDLTINAGEIHALVGESGSGKTVTARSILGLLPVPPASINGGSVRFEQLELVGLTELELREIRGNRIAMVFQEPSLYLNPAFRVGEQITEMLIVHRGRNRKQAVEDAQELLDKVGLGEKRRVLSSYPHELSGGMKQRAMIAMAISCGPSLLIADEPTTALDVTVQRQILQLLLKLNHLLGMAILFISHDLAVVHEISDMVSVIYAGKIVETGGRNQLFDSPLHPYTKLLLASVPDAERRGQRLQTIPGRIPDAEEVPSGCAFHPRCPWADEICKNTVPPLFGYEDGRKAACHMI